MVDFNYIDEGSVRRIELVDQDHLDKWLKKQGIQSLRRDSADGPEVYSFGGIASTINYYPGPPLKTDKKAGSVDKNWQAMYERLIKYKQTHGDCLVPIRYQNDTKLGRWINKQRDNKKRGTMSTDRHRRLDEIGFVWEIRPKTSSWDDTYEKLVRYKQIHGDCLVPQNYSNDYQLGKWVSKQRQLKKLGKLTAKQQRRLEEIGFVWEIITSFWDDMYKKLVKYKQTHGDCLVPICYQDDIQLGRWVDKQRQNKKKGKLTNDRQSQLEEIGFVWEIRNTLSWDDMYEKLVKYKQINGDCLLTQSNQDDKRLGVWIKRQRECKKKGKLSKEKQKRLDDIGFVWCEGRGQLKPFGAPGMMPQQAQIQQQQQQQQLQQQHLAQAMYTQQLMNPAASLVFPSFLATRPYDPFRSGGALSGGVGLQQLAGQQPSPLGASISQPKRRNSFPETLHKMLTEVERAGKSYIISFVGNGNVFKIHKPRDFVNDLLPLYYPKQIKTLISFQKQLHLYGFQLNDGIGIYSGCYFHPFFVKNSPDLCKAIRRKNLRAPNASKRQQERGVFPPTVLAGSQKPPPPPPPPLAPEAIEAMEVVVVEEDNNAGAEKQQQEEAPPPPPPIEEEDEKQPPPPTETNDNNKEQQPQKEKEEEEEQVAPAAEDEEKESSTTTTKGTRRGSNRKKRSIAETETETTTTEEEDKVEVEEKKEATTTTKKKSRSSTRKKKEEDDDAKEKNEEKVAKEEIVVEEEEQKKATPKKKRGSTRKKKDEDELVEEEEEKKATPKKKRSTRKKKDESEDEKVEEEEEDVVVEEKKATPKKKRGSTRKKKDESEDENEVDDNDNDDDDMVDDTAVTTPTRSGKRRRITSRSKEKDEEEEEEEETPKKTKRAKRGSKTSTKASST